jgi:hypothetical protein
MMNESESNQQASALIRFQKSIGRPVGPRWPWRNAREPIVHKEWRRAARMVRRFNLFADSQIEEITPLMRQLFYEAEGRERRAWRKWSLVKRRITMSFLTGKRKAPPPPWGC